MGVKMGFFIISLCFGFIVLLCILLTVYMYLRLFIAVKTDSKVPNWIYKFGQSFQGRVHIKYENITEPAALIDVNIFIFLFILVNIFSGIFIYYKNYNFHRAVYSCLKYEFVIITITFGLYSLIKIILILLKTSNKSRHLYSPSNAVTGAIFLTVFILTLWVHMVGLPEKPISVQIDGSNVIVGKTKASVLLDDGFIFTGKTAETKIINSHNDHFYYGEIVEISKYGKSYGFMSLTPTYKDSDELKNCIITYYEVPADIKVLSDIKFNNTDLYKLQISDFQTKNMAEIFSLDPVDYKEIKNPGFFKLKLQTVSYSLWKSYSIEANFYGDDTPSYYSVRAQHTIWE